MILSVDSLFFSFSFLFLPPSESLRSMIFSFLVLHTLYLTRKSSIWCQIHRILRENLPFGVRYIVSYAKILLLVLDTSYLTRKSSFWGQIHRILHENLLFWGQIHRILHENPLFGVRYVVCSMKNLHLVLHTLYVARKTSIWSYIRCMQRENSPFGLTYVVCSMKNLHLMLHTLYVAWKFHFCTQNHVCKHSNKLLYMHQQANYL